MYTMWGLRKDRMEPCVKHSSFQMMFLPRLVPNPCQVFGLVGAQSPQPYTQSISRPKRCELKGTGMRLCC